MASGNRAARSVTRRRLWTLVLACVATLGIVASGSVQPTATEASWTSADQTKAAFVAITVPSPAVTSCSGTALSTAVTIKWTLPTTGGYTTADVEFGGSSTGLGTVGNLLGASTSATTGPVNGVYTTTLSSSVLGGVLGSLLGTTIYISLWTKYKPSSGISSTWVSAPVGYKVTYPAVLGVLGGTCSAP
jgi:hypothetical protein